MKENDLIDIWKKGAEAEIPSYTEAELNGIALRNARKALRRMYPRWIFGGLNILALGIVTWQLAVSRTPAFRIYYAAILLIIAVCLTGLWIAQHRFRRRSADTTVREWLATRIEKLDRQEAFRRKYGVWSNAVALLAALLAVVILNYLRVEHGGLSGQRAFWAILWGMLCASVTLCLVLRSVARRTRRTRRELQELYDQLEESEEESFRQSAQIPE